MLTGRQYPTLLRLNLQSERRENQTSLNPANSNTSEELSSGLLHSSSNTSEAEMHTSPLGPFPMCTNRSQGDLLLVHSVREPNRTPDSSPPSFSAESSPSSAPSLPSCPSSSRKSAVKRCSSSGLLNKVLQSSSPSDVFCPALEAVQKEQHLACTCSSRSLGQRGYLSLGLYPVELNSMAVRTEANVISAMTNWLSNFLSTSCSHRISSARLISQVVQVFPTMTASINAYTFLLFSLANCLFLPLSYFFHPETSGRTLEELDVLFAHAHLTQRRPTSIAGELPKLTNHQIQAFSDRYDFHGGATTKDPEQVGAAGTVGEMDTTLPPTHPEEMRESTNEVKRSKLDSGETSGQTTRAGSPSGQPEERMKPKPL